jgi:hypothetical protein
MGYAYCVIHNPSPATEIERGAQNRGLDFPTEKITMGIAHLGECSKEVLDEWFARSVREVRCAIVL